MSQLPGRRRFIRIAAAATLAQLAATATAVRAEAGSISAWRGTAMGNLTRIEIRHPDGLRAARILSVAAAEIARLESIFTLYRADSALARLNRAGRLAGPPLDLVRLLAEAHDLSEGTDGAFDVTVQPIWQAYAAHFFAAGADPSGPPADAIRRAVDLVDYRSIEVGPQEIRLARPGMALTLNGIAPGYMTDRIIEVLKNEGLDCALVDLGEIRTAGMHSATEPWRVGLRDPLDERRVAMTLPLTEQAVATSGGYGFRFDTAGRFHHLFDPRTGACPQSYASISVVAPTATIADALATACQLTPLGGIAPVLKASTATCAIAMLYTGQTHIVNA
jgi:thiamine biosynthesis lipoprotein